MKKPRGKTGLFEKPGFYRVFLNMFFFLPTLPPARLKGQPSRLEGQPARLEGQPARPDGQPSWPASIVR